MNRGNVRLLALSGSLLCLIALAGCASDEPKMTPEEVKNFKGGPMPESARLKMQEKMQAANAKGAANGAAPVKTTP